MDPTNQDPHDPVVLAWHNLEDAIRALTDTLEYEWEGEFLTEIKTLAHTFARYKVAQIRKARGQ